MSDLITLSPLTIEEIDLLISGLGWGVNETGGAENKRFSRMEKRLRVLLHERVGHRLDAVTHGVTCSDHPTKPLEPYAYRWCSLCVKALGPRQLICLVHTFSKWFRYPKGRYKFCTCCAYLVKQEKVTKK